MSSQVQYEGNCCGLLLYHVRTLERTYQKLTINTEHVITSMQSLIAIHSDHIQVPLRPSSSNPFPTTIRTDLPDIRLLAASADPGDESDFRISVDDFADYYRRYPA